MDTSTNGIEGTLTTSDGLELYTKTWPTASTPKARLVFLHGFSDHCNFYGILFPSLAEQGIKVYSFDQRGWGRSVHKNAQRGLTGGTRQVLDDITLFIRNLPVSESSIPLFLMGHSMGGAETLVYGAHGPADVRKMIRGYLCESPFVALHPDAKPWKATVLAGRLAAKLLPSGQMPNKLDARKICRDPEVCRVWAEDPLCHDTGTFEGLAGMLDRAADLEGGRATLKEGEGEGGATRLWIGHGTADAICDFDAARKYFDATPIADKEFKQYDGWYHKLHSEPDNDKVEFARDAAKWIIDRSGDLSANKSKL